MCNRTQREVGYHKGDERYQRLLQLWRKDGQSLPKVARWSYYDPTCSRPRFHFDIETACLDPLARVSIDLVTRKAKRNDRTSFESSNTCPILVSYLSRGWLLVVERWTMTEISVGLDWDPNAALGCVTRTEERANELSVFLGDARSRM